MELRSLQRQSSPCLLPLIEANLDTLLGIRFLATEYSTGKTRAGRIDSLGLDENICPVILGYKRSVGANVINQGLFYLDWLMDHQAEFKLLVMDKAGQARGRCHRLDGTAAGVHCRRLHQVRRACGAADQPQHRADPISATWNWPWPLRQTWMRRNR